MRPVPGPLRPIRLRRLLVEHNIQQEQLRQVMMLPNGKSIGKTSTSLLLSRNQWPVTLPRAPTIDAVSSFLRERGVPAELADRAWDRDEIDHSSTVETPATTLQLPEYAMLSDAARKQFNLFRHPFQDDVTSHADLFLNADQRYVRDSMYYAAKHGGFVAIVGESGSGKSTLRRDLIDRLRRDNEPIVIIQPRTIDKARLTAQHICEAIIGDLGSEHPRKSAEARTRQIERILSGSSRAGNSHALLIEEAHDLSVSTLKLLKRFWELEDGFKRLLGIILVGQPELGDRLDERRNYDAREVIRRCEVARLKPLDASLEDYLHLKFTRIGADPAAIVEPDAYDAIRDRLTLRRRSGEVESHVYPLVVHNLLIRAMNQAAELGFGRVSAELVRGV